MLHLLFFTFLFATINMHLSDQEKSKRSSFFLWNLFFSAILANVVWVVVLPQAKSLGSSGIVYASMGIVMGLSLDTTCHDFRNMLRNLKNEPLKNFFKKYFSIIYNLSVFSSFLFFIIANPEKFLSAGPGINTLVHSISFIASFLMVTVLCLHEPEKVMLKFSRSNWSYVMPKKETAEDLVTRETWLLYYLWRVKGFHGNISALSRELGYKDDSAVNKRIHTLKQKGCVEEEQTKTGTVFKITGKGERKIIFLILPRYFLYIILALTFADIFWGLLGLFGVFHVQSWNILLVGIISMPAIIFLIWAYRKSEEELLKIGRPESES
jgi:hypothetical protein